MSETAPAPAAAPSAPAAGTQTSTPNTSSSPARRTTAELAQSLSGGNRLGVDIPDVAEEALSSETPEPTESAPQESQWYETYKDVHGVPVQELLEALSNGQIPEQLYEKLLFELKDGDRTWQADLKTLRNGAMMREDHTRKTQALAEERKKFFAERDELVDYIKGWKESPEQLLFGMERMGLPVLEAARLLAERLTYADELNKKIPGSGDEWLAAIKDRAELSELRKERERQMQQQERAKGQDREAKVRTQLQSASKEIFGKIGLELEESSWNLYTQHVQAIYDSKVGDKKLTRGDLEKAATLTQSQLQRYAQLYAQKAPKAAPGSQLGTIPLDAGAPKGVPARAPQKQNGKKTTAEVQQAIRDRAGIRQR